MWSPDKDDIIGEVNESAYGFEWKIHNFSCLSEEDFVVYYSPLFNFNDASWYFGIYPNSLYNSEKYVDLYVIKTSGSFPTRMEFSLALKTENEEKASERQCTKVFESTRTWHVSTKLISRSELRKRMLELVPSGVLTVMWILKISKPPEHSSGTSTAACRHCKGNISTENILLHETKCMERPIKCPDCFDVFLLQNWLYNHECQEARVEDDKTLCEDLKKVLLHGLNYDLTLKVGGKEIRAHQDILRARSKVFESMLRHDTQEKKSGVIDIPDCDAQAMEQFLHYIYTGRVNSLEESNMLNLYYIADKYDQKGLKEKCCAFIKILLSVSNICDVIQLALNHSDSGLLEHATEYFKDNVLDIMRTVEWQNFMKDNSTVANELTIKSIEKLKNVKI